MIMNPLAVEQHERKEPTSYAEVQCGNCNQRYEDHIERGYGRQSEMWCPDAAEELDAMLDNAGNRFVEMDEQEARDEARLRWAERG